MPTYEYSCQKCGEQIEVFQSFSAKPLKKHAECGGALQKVFHPRGVVFKGSGFYKTDSKKSPPSESTTPANKESKKSSNEPSTPAKEATSTKSDS